MAGRVARLRRGRVLLHRLQCLCGVEEAKDSIPRERSKAQPTISLYWGIQLLGTGWVLGGLLRVKSAIFS